MSTIRDHKEIIAKLKNRDPEAINLILTIYGDRLYGYIFHYLQSEKLAAEVMEKAFLNIWKYSEEYNKAPKHFFIWLLGIVKKTMDEDYSIQTQKERT